MPEHRRQDCEQDKPRALNQNIPKRLLPIQSADEDGKRRAVKRLKRQEIRHASQPVREKPQRDHGAGQHGQQHVPRFQKPGNLLRPEGDKAEKHLIKQHKQITHQDACEEHKIQTDLCLERDAADKQDQRIGHDAQKEILGGKGKLVKHD